MDEALRAVSRTEREPVAVDVPLQPAAPVAVAPSVLASDAGLGPDLLGRAPGAAFLAELALHRGAETPFCIGLLGPEGVGKSTFAAEVVAAAERLAAAAEEAGLASAFARDVVVVRPDLAGTGEADVLLAQAVQARLSATHPELAAELGQAGADPSEAADAASERLDALRRRLDAERTALDTMRGREARLLEAAAETPGSSVDAYARSRRSSIARALRPFGFAATDPVASYKALVREAAEEAGTGARLGLSIRALTAFQGQMRLIVWACVFAVVGWGCAWLRDDAAWLDGLRGMGDRAAPVADWLAGQVGWLGSLETVALLLAVLLLLVNVLRAARFVLPLSRGVDLLQGEVDSRRRDLLGAIAHQTRRTDAVARDVEAATATASEAERRAVGAARPADGSPPAAASGALFAALRAGAGRAGPPRPERILVLLDGLDADPARGAAFLSTAHRLFGPGFVTVAVADPDRLAMGFGADLPAVALARCIQLPYRVGLGEAADAVRQGYAMTLLAPGEARSSPIATPDVRRSTLDLPWADREAATVAALAPVAGATPRAIKRFVNLYRVARADPRLADAPRSAFTALAIALALDAQGRPDILAALDEASRGEPVEAPDALRRAVAAARDASGEPVELDQARRALEVAATYSAAAQPADGMLRSGGSSRLAGPDGEAKPARRDSSRQRR